MRYPLGLFRVLEGSMLRVLLALSIVGFSSCTCQRAENIEAKERLSKPAPPNPHVLAADDKIDAENLTSADVMKRVVNMEGTEIAARLKSFRFDSHGDLSFTRGEGGLKSAETTRML